MRYDYALGCGLPLLIMGIAFFRSRFLYIKKGFIATATVFKQVEYLDEENNIYYKPYFSFTTHYDKEVIYKHTRDSQQQDKWYVGKQTKVVYRTNLNEEHEILLLTFYDTFAFSTTFLTLGFFFFYWQAECTLTFLIKRLPALYLFQQLPTSLLSMYGHAGLLILYTNERTKRL